MRIPRDRYRDLFENSSEMIATLDMSGKFLYANPAWRQCFRLDRNAQLDEESFANVFGPACREEAAALLKKALEGVTVDRAPLRTETPDGYQITPYDEAFARQMEVAERVMHENRDVLRQLAK